MKKAILLAVCVLTVSLAAGARAETPGWFDLENCSFCKNLAAQPGLLENLGWEHFTTADGMLSVTTFRNQAACDGYAVARAQMEEVGQRMMAGEKVHMCGFCTSMSGLAMGGARIEEFPTENGSVLLVSSGDPAMVEKIHDHAERTIQELAAMMPTE